MGHKYHAKRTVCASGHSHPSMAEAKRCGELTLLEQTGHITHLEHQPRFPIVINGAKICTYVADFMYYDESGRIVEDTKGFRTREYIIKKKLVEALYRGTKITETRA